MLTDNGISTIVTEEDIANGVKDEFGAIYSQDGKRLLRAPRCTSTYSIRQGTLAICDYAFYYTIHHYRAERRKHHYGYSDEYNDDSFQFKSIVSIEIPNSVTIIGDGAFSDCDRLAEIKVESGNQFYDSRNNCNAIIEAATNTLIVGCKNTIIPNSVTSIGCRAFQGCSGLSSITIPDSVTSIGPWAFKRFKGLFSITISDHVTSIGEGAFWGCSELTSIIIPKSVTIIGKGVLSHCDRMAKIIVESGNQFYDSRNNCNAIIETATNTLIVGCKNTIIPDSVTSIASLAFRGCRGLSIITIPDLVTSIGDNAFENCSELTDVNIPNLVTSIGDNAFKGCSKLTDIIIPKSVTQIGKSAFSQCERLENVKIPNSVTCIGTGIFDGCEKLTSIIIPNKSMQRFQELLGDYRDKLIEQDNWKYSPSTKVTYEDQIQGVKDEFGAIYSRDGKRLIKAPLFFKTYSIRPGTLAICDKAFDIIQLRPMESIEIPNSVLSIGDWAFARCKGLTDIPDSVVSIGDGAFEDSRGLTNITIPKSLTSIGDRVFSGCGLTSITIHDSVTRIGNLAFWHCGRLKSINIPDSVTSISDGAFEGCSGLTDITISNSLTSIGNRVFSGCYRLTSITIPASVQHISESAFNDCSALTSIQVSDKNKTYDSRGDCNAVIHTATNTLILGCKNTIIPDSVTHIGNGAFNHCRGLVNITIPNSVTHIGDNAFSSCSYLTSITIPESVTYIGKEAFSGCVALSEIHIPSGCYDKFKKLLPDLEEFFSEPSSPDCTSNPNNLAELKVIQLSTKATYEDRVNGVEDEFGAIYSPDGKRLIDSSSVYASHFSIKPGTQVICDKASHRCRNLTIITIPNSVTQIGKGAFSGCRELMRAIIPNSVMYIGNWVFFACNSLTSIQVGRKNKLYDSRNNCNAIIHSATNTLIAGCMNTIIPDSVLIIEEGSFCGHIGLSSIIIPSSIELIKERAFVGCSGLISIMVINNKTYDSRENCNAIIHTATNTLIVGCKGTIIPNSVTRIGNHAFEGCYDLKSITIPDSITHIGDDAFSGCRVLSEVHIPAGSYNKFKRLLPGLEDKFVES